MCLDDIRTCDRGLTVGATSWTDVAVASPAEEIGPLGTGEVAQEAYAETLDRAANTAAHLRGRDLDHVLVEFADSEARGLVNERPSRSCASG